MQWLRTLLVWVWKTVAARVVGAVALALLGGTAVSAIFAGVAQWKSWSVGPVGLVAAGALGWLGTVFLFVWISTRHGSRWLQIDLAVTAGKPNAAEQSRAADEKGAPSSAHGSADSGQARVVRVEIPISALELVSMCNRVTSIQSESMMAAYVGHWLIVRGTVSTVYRDLNDLDRVVLLSLDDDRTVSAEMVFAGDIWAARLDMLQKGSTISATGRLRRASVIGVKLYDCELTA